MTSAEGLWFLWWTYDVIEGLLSTKKKRSNAQKLQWSCNKSVYIFVYKQFGWTSFQHTEKILLKLRNPPGYCLPLRPRRWLVSTLTESLTSSALRLLLLNFGRCMKLINCASHILYHISYIIYHISYIIYHISYIVSQISYITHHTSYIIYHIIHIYHVSHVHPES